MYTMSEILQITTLTKQCRECSKVFELKDCPAITAKYIELCETCCDRQESERQKRATEQAALGVAMRRARAWEGICPRDYRQTDAERLPRNDLLPLVMQWEFGPHGLLLHGPTGTGKSRCAWLLLKREHDQGRRILVLDHSIGFRYAEMFDESPGKAAGWIEQLSSAHILFLDDVFKARLTDSLQGALFTVIAARCEAQRPIIVTTNDTGESLTERLSTDRSAALVRRLIEHTKQIPFT
jgi:DNA replication protein DnaC